MTAVRRAVVAFVLLGTPGPMSAQSAVRGLVLADSGSTPIEGAVVEIAELRKSATTDARGAVVLGGLRPWRYTVKARRLGYEPVELEVQVGEGDTARVLFRLKASAATLAPVTVTESNPEAVNPRMAGFNDRRKMGIGHFMTNADLRKMDQSTMQELVRQLGMSVKLTACPPYCPPGRPYAIGRRGPSSFRSTVCPVQVFVDGVPFLATGSPFDLSTVRVEEVGALEFYAGASQTPLIFEKGSSMCGVLLLWTRTTQP